MAAQILLLDFQVGLDICFEDGVKVIVEAVASQLAKHGQDDNINHLLTHTTNNVNTVVYIATNDNLLTIRFMIEKRLFTLTVEGPYLAPNNNGIKNVFDPSLPKLFENNSDKLQLEQGIKTRLERSSPENRSSSPSNLPIITRGLPLSPYYTTTDDRIVERSITSIIHEEVSEFQKIQILDTIDCGRVLMLDDLVNLAESDLIYTHTLMNLPKEDYRDKKILILGGGDGALLHELLQHSPRHVVMVELDPAVMAAVRKNMPAVCGEVLDTHTSHNYQIVVGDAVMYMENCIKEGVKFQYVFGDLTDAPININRDAESIWDFLKKILSLGFGCVEPGGKYMTHVTGKSVPHIMERFQGIVKESCPSCAMQSTQAFVPSFMEVWTFLQIHKLD